MADVNLSVGSSNVLKQYSGYRPGQYINFYCSYSSAGVLSVRLNLSLTGSYNWSSNDSRAWINFNSSSVSGAAVYDGPDRQLSAGNHDVVTESETFTTARTITVYAKLAVRAGTYGPTGDYGGAYNDTWWDPNNPPSDAKTNGGGRCFKFTISIPGIVSKCGAPNSIKINNTTSTVYASPSSSVTVSWSGASSGTGNSISSYLIKWGYSDGGWDYSTTYSTTNSSGSKSITLPSGEAKYIDFRVITRGSAGSTYYSTPYTVYRRVKTFSTPAMPTVSASEQYGTFTITWSKASDETVNAIAGYDVYYQSSSNNSSWSSSVKIGSYTSSTTGIEWENATSGTYYRFGVVARRTNYGSSSLSNWTTGKQASAKPVDLTAPTNLTPSVTEIIGGKNITVTWGASTATAPNSIKNYALYYSLNNGSNTLISNSISASATSYTFKVPKSYGSMVFKIQALSSISSEYNSSIVSASQAVNVITGISDDLRMRFKKDGTIQCVKVVETGGEIGYNNFKWKWNDSRPAPEATERKDITFNNRWKIEFYKGNTQVTNIGGGMLSKISLNDVSSSTSEISLNPVLPSGNIEVSIESYWIDSNKHFYIGSISLYSGSSSLNSYIDRVDITKGIGQRTSFMFSSSASSGSKYTYMNPTPLTIAPDDRKDITPVSISKDGTLTCNKLIQEEPTIKLYKDGTVKCGNIQEATISAKNWGNPSIVTSNKLDFEFTNGYKIQVYSDDSLFPYNNYTTMYFYDTNLDNYLFYITISSGLFFYTGNDFKSMEEIKIDKVTYSTASALPSATNSYINITVPNGTTHRLSLKETPPTQRIYGIVNTNTDSATIIPASDRIMLSWD